MRKVRRPSFREENQKLLGDWLVRVADKRAVAKSLGVSYPTMARRANSIAEGQMVTDLFTFNEMLQLVDLQNIDAEKPESNGKMVTKEQKLNEQVEQVAKVMESMGRKVDREALKKSMMGDNQKGTDDDGEK
mgnify:FL=1